MVDPITIGAGLAAAFGTAGAGTAAAGGAAAAGTAAAGAGAAGAGAAAAGGGISSWLPWIGAGAAAAGAAGSLLGGKGTAPPPNVNIPAPPGVVPAQTPNSKPQRKSQQAGFLSGAAMAQQSGAGGTSTGKSLLGA